MRVVEHLGRPLLPELEVDVLGRIDAEPVDSEVDPVLVHVHEAVHDGGVLGHQVVEADEVAEGDRFACPGRVAAVVVQSRVVEPRRHLDVGIRLGDHRRVREARRRIQRGERVRARVLGGIEDVSSGVAVGAGRLVDVRELVLFVRDDVGGVVGDDVEVHLDAAGVGIGDQRLELGVRAEVRVDLREVGDPVAVVARARVLALALDGAVLEARRQPDRARSETLDVVELRAQAGKVAALVEALVGRVEARREPVAGETPGVIRGVAVGESVGHHEVELLRAARLSDGVSHKRVVFGRVVTGERCRLEADPLGVVIEDEPQRRGPGDRQRDVAAAAVQPIGLVPGPVHRHLVVVVACRDGELCRIHTGGVGRGEVCQRTVGEPVVGAAQFVLQGAHERERALGGRGRRGGERRKRRCCPQAPGLPRRGWR